MIRIRVKKRNKKTWILEHTGKGGEHPPKERVTKLRHLHRWSKRVFEAGADRKCKSLVFSTGGDVEFVYVAPNVGDPPDRVVVSSLFPCGAISARLTCFPGTDVKLLNEWRVIVSNNVASSPFNKAVMKYCGREWTGNIALIKYSRSNRQKLNNVPCTEFEFAHLLLSAWLRNLEDAREDAE